MAKTVVIGASTNPERYAYLAVQRLKKHGHEVVPVGRREGEIEGVPIQTGQPPINNVHTISLYLGANNQPPMYDYLLSLKPKRVIFNPGTENPELKRKLLEQDVEVLDACTLVLLSTGDFDR